MSVTYSRSIKLVILFCILINTCHSKKLPQMSTATNDLTVLQCPWGMCGFNQPCCSVAPSPSIVGNSTRWIGQPMAAGQTVVLETAHDNQSQVYLEKYGDTSHAVLKTAGVLSFASSTDGLSPYYLQSGTTVSQTPACNFGPNNLDALQRSPTKETEAALLARCFI